MMNFTLSITSTKWITIINIGLLVYKCLSLFILCATNEPVSLDSIADVPIAPNIDNTNPDADPGYESSSSWETYTSSSEAANPEQGPHQEEDTFSEDDPDPEYTDPRDTAEQAAAVNAADSNPDLAQLQEHRDQLAALSDQYQEDLANVAEAARVLQGMDDLSGVDHYKLIHLQIEATAKANVITNIDTLIKNIDEHISDIQERD